MICTHPSLVEDFEPLLDVDVLRVARVVAVLVHHAVDGVRVAGVSGICVEASQLPGGGGR